MDDFWNFVEDIGSKPDGFFLDRINNDGNYEPENCRWVPPKISANNKRPAFDIHDRMRDELGRFI